MGAKVEEKAQLGATAAAKAPRTPRGERTLRKILDAAREEFGERGFSDSSIVGITQRRRRGSRYFLHLLLNRKRHCSRRWFATCRPRFATRSDRRSRDAADGLDGERRALAAFLRFAHDHRDIYRIIDKSEFVEPAAYREHYETTAVRIAARLTAARDKGEISRSYADEELDVLAWGMMGANVFLGLRFAVSDDSESEHVAEVMSRVWRRGFAA